MTLTLAITNVDKLENGVSTRLKLDRHGAVIGRSPHADWSLPDPRSYISSTHCEIDYRDGAYVLVDKSTNGTFLNGRPERLTRAHTLCDGDVFLIGHYEVKVMLSGQVAKPAGSNPEPRNWGGWDAHVESASAKADPAEWSRPAPQSAIGGQGPMSQNWAPPAASAQAAEPASVWASITPPTEPASSWSSPVTGASSTPSAVDVWGALAAGAAVDWKRSGFGASAPDGPDRFGLSPVSPAASDRLGSPYANRLESAAPSSSAASSAWGAVERASGRAEPTTIPVDPTGAAYNPAPNSAGASSPREDHQGHASREWSAFVTAAGLDPSTLHSAPEEALAAAGEALLRMTGGLIVMLEARAKQKSQLGAQGTTLEFQGNNPLKFARTREQALSQLLNPPVRGFMPAETAIEDAFKDLQAHQMATLMAMQGALAATLARFSPSAIRDRAESRGVLAKIIPAARESELWKAYEREFEGVVKGSDEAFMDVFAREFRLAYERTAADMKR